MEVRNHIPLRSAVQLVIVLVIIIAFVPTEAKAQLRFPENLDQYVNDHAGLIKPADVAQTRQALRTFKEASGIEVVVVTINSISRYSNGITSIETYAEALFNHWGIGDASLNNGILLLIAFEDNELRIQLGDGFRGSDEVLAQRIIDQVIVPHFKDGEFSAGILQGATAIANSFVFPPGSESDENLSAPSGSSAFNDRSIQTRTEEPQYPSSSVILAAAGLLAGMGIIGWQRYSRQRERRCRKCQRKMARLDEFDDDVYLDSGQQVEEYLSAVDYDVWKCHNCGEYEMHRYGKLLGAYKKCPECNYKTLSTVREHMYAATYEREGEIWVTKYCYHCEFRDKRIIYTPVRTPNHYSHYHYEDDQRRHHDDPIFSLLSGGGSGSSRRSSSSSSRSSSRGGGRSSGRGSSGKW